MAGAGAEFTDQQKNVIRYVVAMNSDKLERDKLPWKPVETEMIVYRGQSGQQKSILAAEEGARAGWSTILSVFRGKPATISTTTQLNRHILGFAKGFNTADPSGKLFQIKVIPGVRHVDFKKEYKAMGPLYDGSQDFKFQFLKDEMDEHAQREYIDKGIDIPSEHYSKKTLEQLRKIFATSAQTENEILIDLAGTEFVNSSGTAETWSDPAAFTEVPYVSDYKVEEKSADGRTWKEYHPILSTSDTRLDNPKNRLAVKTKTVPVYSTVLRPKGSAGGRRGRTFRTKTLRRNKHGRRPTRKSKHRVRNRHA